jgi:integrase
MLILDYEINGKKSIDRMMHSVKALTGHFDGIKAQSVTTDKIKGYIKQRKEDGKANATINRELAALKRMFNLAHQQSPPKVNQVPYIPMLKENNVRAGFFEPKEFSALMRNIAPYLRNVITLAYETGMRQEEILSLKWSQVDLTRKTIRLEETKSGEKRTLKLSPLLRLEFQRAKLAHGDAHEYVFLNRDGTGRIKDFRSAWRQACEKAGIGKRHFHDFRRTAIRNMVRAGVADNVAMKISGHKTRSVFDRYNIVDDRDIADAMEKIRYYLARRKPKSKIKRPKVIRLPQQKVVEL